MSIAVTGSSAVFWQSQLPVDYLDTSLVQDTWETVSANLSSGRPCRIHSITVEQTNNGATAEDLELEITIDGTAYTVGGLGAIASGTPIYAYLTHNLTAGDFQFYATATARKFGSAVSASDGGPCIFRNVSLIRVRQTTDVDGTSAQIEVNIAWDKLVGL